MLTKKDCAALRELAARYAEIAALPIQREKQRLWLRLNTLQMERPMALIDQIPWNEMDVDGSLRCEVEDPYWRSVEENLRRTLYQWAHMPADMVVLPWLCLPRPIQSSGWGIEIQKDRVISLEEGATATSSQYRNQIQEMEDLERIQMPRITLDRARETEIIQQAHALLDGVLPFKMTGLCLHLGLWDTISQWMGVENCYIALLDDPDMMHALMEKLTLGALGIIDQLNRIEGFDVVSAKCHCSHTFLPDLPGEDGAAVSGNAWAFGMAQLFTAVSPAVTAEFELPYMERIFPHLGAIYYGCCERLDDRLDVIRKLPKIRKLSCSPWSDREHFAEAMPECCVMSNKPSPALLAADTLDEDEIRRDIRRTITAAKRCNRSLEMILKDISTVRHQPQRLWTWARIAQEEVTA